MRILCTISRAWLSVSMHAAPMVYLANVIEVRMVLPTKAHDHAKSDCGCHPSLRDFTLRPLCS